VEFEVEDFDGFDGFDGFDPDEDGFDVDFD
jgi:hypothetical protein